MRRDDICTWILIRRGLATGFAGSLLSGARFYRSRPESVVASFYSDWAWRSASLADTRRCRRRLRGGVADSGWCARALSSGAAYALAEDRRLGSRAASEAAGFPCRVASRPPALCCELAPRQAVKDTSVVGPGRNQRLTAPVTPLSDPLSAGRGRLPRYSPLREDCLNFAPSIGSV